jgi:phosphoribosylformylglycinamidine synthase
MGEENCILGKYGYEVLQIQMALVITQPCFCDKTGRHLVMMPHIERSTFQWNWAHYQR